MSQYSVLTPGTDTTNVLQAPFAAELASEFAYNNGLTQSANASLNRPARSPFPRWAISTDHTLITTGQAWVTAVPLYNGDTITNITVPIGGTAGATGTHSIAALYSTNAANTTLTLLSNSADITTATWTANTARSYVLSTPQAITTSGIYYVLHSFTGGTMPSYLGVLQPTVAAAATGYSINSLQQPMVGAVGGSAIGNTAPATITVSGYTVVGTSGIPTPYVVCW